MRNIYLFLGAILIGGCSFKKIKKVDTEISLPKGESFTLSNDSNLSNLPIPFFRKLFPNEELESLMKAKEEKQEFNI